MPSSKLTVAQIVWVVQQVAAYIGEQGDIYVRRAASLTTSQKLALRRFFPGSALSSGVVPA
jgi:hypothetical protein